MDNGSIVWVFLWLPLWAGVAVGAIAVIILGSFALHVALRLTLDTAIAAMRDRPGRRARREREYIKRHQRENAG